MTAAEAREARLRLRALPPRTGGMLRPPGQLDSYVKPEPRKSWRMKPSLSLEESAEGVGMREYPVRWWPDSWLARLAELEHKLSRSMAVAQCYAEALTMHCRQVRQRKAEIPKSSCSSCGASIVWVVTRNQKRMPLDSELVVAAPDSLAGTEPRTVVTPEGQVVRGFVPRDGYTGPVVKGRVSHFATCPNAEEHRRG